MAQAVKPLEPEVVSQYFQPIREEKVLTAKSISSPSVGGDITDFGQNLSGVELLHMKGKSGEDIRLRFAEVLNPDGTMYGIFAPGTSSPNPGFGPGWSDAGVVILWTGWIQSGNKQIIDENWDGMEKYLAEILAKNPNYLNQKDYGIPFGDWLTPTATTPEDLLATAYWAYDASLMEQMAAATGRKEKAAEWMYRYGAGVDASAADAGFHRIYLHPNFSAKLGSMKLSYDSAYGSISSSWTVDGTTASWKFTIPANTTAELALAATNASSMLVGGVTLSPMSKFYDVGTKRYRFGAGTYAAKAALK